jgi:hypothetical protein
MPINLSKLHYLIKRASHFKTPIQLLFGCVWLARMQYNCAINMELLSWMSMSEVEHSEFVRTPRRSEQCPNYQEEAQWGFNVKTKFSELGSRDLRLLCQAPLFAVCFHQQLWPLSPLHTKTVLKISRIEPVTCACYLFGCTSKTHKSKPLLQLFNCGQTFS